MKRLLFLLLLLIPAVAAGQTYVAPTGTSLLTFYCTTPTTSATPLQTVTGSLAVSIQCLSGTNAGWWLTSAGTFNATEGVAGTASLALGSTALGKAGIVLTGAQFQVGQQYDAGIKHTDTANPILIYGERFSIGNLVLANSAGLITGGTVNSVTGAVESVTNPVITNSYTGPTLNVTLGPSQAFNNTGQTTPFVATAGTGQLTLVPSIVYKSVDFGTPNSGLTGSVGFTLVNSDSTVKTARTIVGVTERGTSTGIYGAAVTVEPGWIGEIRWDDGTHYASDEIYLPLSLQTSGTPAVNAVQVGSALVTSPSGGVTFLSTVGSSNLSATIQPLAVDAPVQRGATSVMKRVFIPDRTSPTGGGLTSLSSTSAELCIYTQRSKGVVIAYSGASIQSITTVGTWVQPTSSSNCRFKAVSNTNWPGLYEIQFHDSALVFSATDTSDAVYIRVGELSGLTDLNIGTNLLKVPLVPWDNQDGVRLGLTALPNANANDAPGGLVTIGTALNRFKSDSNANVTPTNSGDTTTLLERVPFKIAKGSSGVDGGFCVLADNREIKLINSIPDHYAYGSFTVRGSGLGPVDGTVLDYAGIYNQSNLPYFSGGGWSLFHDTGVWYLQAGTPSGIHVDYFYSGIVTERFLGVGAFESEARISYPTPLATPAIVSAMTTSGGYLKDLHDVKPAYAPLVSSSGYMTMGNTGGLATEAEQTAQSGSIRSTLANTASGAIGAAIKNVIKTGSDDCIIITDSQVRALLRGR